MYGIDLRKKVIAFLDNSGTYRGAARIFGVTMYTTQQWKKLLRETCLLDHKKRSTPFKKLDPTRLSAYIEEHPDTYLREVSRGIQLFCASCFYGIAKAWYNSKKKIKVYRENTKD